MPLEVGDHWKPYYTNPLQLVQWTMASAVNHSVLQSTVDKIIDRIERLSLKEIMKADVTVLTGPGPWSEAIQESWAEHGIDWTELRGFGDKSRVVVDQLIFPIFGFA